MTHILSWACLLALVAGSTALRDTSTVSISRPLELQKEYRHSEALFGYPSYGGEITGVVVWLNSTGCNEIHPDASWPENPILMVDRGDCYFSNKVRNAELAGAQAVIVADNAPLCGPTADGGSPQCPSCASCGTEPHQCACVLPVMSPAGFSEDINIPSVLMSEYDTGRMKDCIAGKAPCHTRSIVITTISWVLPESSTVDWALWTVAGSVSTSLFRQGFYPWVKELGAAARFRPQYFVYNGSVWHCTSQRSPGVYNCDSECTNQGRYCLPDPEGNKLIGIDGADVIRENLRQLCVWQQANETYATDYGARWWKYVMQFDKECSTNKFTSQTCVEAQMLSAGIDPDRVYTCMAASGGTSDSGDNTLLRAQLEARSTAGIARLPTIVVNGITQRGGTTPGSVLRTICAGYTGGTEPAVCQCIALDPQYIDKCLPAAPEIIDNNNIPTWLIVLFVVVPIVFMAACTAGFIFLYRRQKREMRDILANYQQLAAGPTGADDGPVPAARGSPLPSMGGDSGKAVELSRPTAL